MIDPYNPFQNPYPVKIIYSQYRWALILVTNKAETFRLASIFVANKIDIDHFAILGEDADYVTFGQIERKATHEYPGAVPVLVVPGRLAVPEQFLLTQLLDVFHVTMDM